MLEESLLRSFSDEDDSFDFRIDVNSFDVVEFVVDHLRSSKLF